MTLFLQATEGIDISSIASLVLPLAITALIFYFMLIRPESKRKKSLFFIYSLSLSFGFDLVYGA
jgi:hypothetical protein